MGSIVNWNGGKSMKWILSNDLPRGQETAILSEFSCKKQSATVLFLNLKEEEIDLNS